MGHQMTVIHGGLISSLPIYHPGYTQGQKITPSILKFSVATNEGKKTSYLNNVVCHGKLAQVYAHTLYPGKPVSMTCISTREKKVVIKDGEISVTPEGIEQTDTWETHRTEYISLYRTSKVIETLREKKANQEILDDLRLPCWNLPAIGREVKSDYKIHEDWYALWSKQPWNGTDVMYGNALVVKDRGRLSNEKVPEVLMPESQPNITEHMDKGLYIIGGNTYGIETYVLFTKDRLRRRMEYLLKNPYGDNLNPEEEVQAKQLQEGVIVIEGLH